MWRIPMGRNDGLLTYKETAERLDVTRRHLSHMIREGYIRPMKIGRRMRDMLFQPEDVNAILNMRQRGVDLPRLAAIAQQAHSLSLTTAAKLEKVCAYLGLENNRLRTDEDSLFMLHMKAQDAMKEELSDLPASAVMEWASIFNGIDEGYLELIAAYTLDQQPWATYMNLANQIMMKQSDRPETNLKFAYACLDAARRHLRHVSYFYVMVRSGERLANDLFIKGEVDDEVIAQLHPLLEVLPH